VLAKYSIEVGLKVNSGTLARLTMSGEDLEGRKRKRREEWAVLDEDMPTVSKVDFVYV
jgi:hypothetical protein